MFDIPAKKKTAGFQQTRAAEIRQYFYVLREAYSRFLALILDYMRCELAVLDVDLDGVTLFHLILKDQSCREGLHMLLNIYLLRGLAP